MAKVAPGIGPIPVEALLAGSRGGPECAVRAAIAHVACDGVGVTCAEIAELLGVSGPEVSLARRRGRDVLAAHGWEHDDVLSWRPGGA